MHSNTGTGERTDLIDPVILGLLEMIVPTARRDRTRGVRRSSGALAGVLERMATPGSPEDRAIPPRPRTTHRQSDNDDGHDNAEEEKSEENEFVRNRSKEEEKEGAREEEEDEEEEEEEKEEEGVVKSADKPFGWGTMKGIFKTKNRN